MKYRLASAIMVLAVLFAACSQETDKQGASEKDTLKKEKKGLSILCSFLPMWVFTKNVVGEREGVDIHVLISGEQGPHDYQLSPADMKKINAADIFVANGYQLEEFLTEAAREARPGLRILKSAEVVEPIYIDEKGHSITIEAEHGSDNHDHHHGHHDRAVNPHVFVSPHHAAKMVRKIGEELGKADPSGKETYHDNAEAYAKKLENLAHKFKGVAEKSSNTKIVTFHNAFDYLGRAAGLDIVGSIEVVPGQQPSAGELSALARKIRETGAVAVFAEPQYSPRMARVLAQEAGVKMDYFDPAATGEMRSDYYEEVMLKNVETLERVLPEDK